MTARCPPVAKDSGYYTTTAFADHAIRCLQGARGEVMPGSRSSRTWRSRSPHFPLHAPPEDIARYRDRYLAAGTRSREASLASAARDGDRRLLPRRRWSRHSRPVTSSPKSWKSSGRARSSTPCPGRNLTDEQKQFQATKMAIHAAMVDRMDREIGRVLDQVRAMGAWDDTIIFFLSDNGTDATILVRGDGHDPRAAARLRRDRSSAWARAGPARATPRFAATRSGSTKAASPRR